MKIQPRSTSRKRRATDGGVAARAPRQERSRKRRDDILDAADELLLHADIENLSLSDVGAKAGMSKASVHYHFPTISAIQLELGRRHDMLLRTRLGEKVALAQQQPVPSWQDWMRIEASYACDYLNNNRPACETLLGPSLHRHNRLMTMKDNAELGRSTLDNLNHMFVVPNEDALLKALPHYGDILDAFWSGDYFKHGKIGSDMLEESLRAGLGYLKNYLPYVLAVRK